MKYTVVITADLPPIAREILEPDFDIVQHATEHDRTEEDVITILDEADAAITLLSDPLTAHVLESLPHLRLVSNYAVGYDNVDVAAAQRLGIRVTNTPGVLTDATADLTMALILATMRRIVESDEQTRRTLRCEWEPLALLGSSLQGKQLGILGMGRIGEAVAHRARAFGMTIAFASRRPRDAEPGRTQLPLAELLATSDVLTIHAPLTTETRHIINRETLAQMKRGSYLVNTSRGPLVDEEALCDALERGHLRGAALDVYEREPAVNPRLRGLRNVVIVPHIGSATDEARTAMARIAAINVSLFLKGREPLHVVI